ncbi:MAG: hypothetical protein H7A23_23705 [Leptospiraceae bacterium]|nr:hypothetical protein [Leptospiraceae bacterium]
MYTLEDLQIFKDNPYDTMIKYTVDTKRKVIAIGGEMHADSEEVLLKNGSNSKDIWGANLLPWQEKASIEYISLINIRPPINKKMEIEIPEIREIVKQITIQWIKLDYEDALS